jgi:hypothetical protein
MGDAEPNIEELETNMGDPEAAADIGPEDPIAEEIELDAVAPAGLLVSLCKIAEQHYGLHIGECDAAGAPTHWGPVHRVHAKGSYHYLHRAADISGLPKSMQRFGKWVGAHHGPRLAELIHNPGSSIKDGQHVPSSFWGDKTWRAHANHVHLAI